MSSKHIQRARLHHFAPMHHATWTHCGTLVSYTHSNKTKWYFHICSIHLITMMTSLLFLSYDATLSWFEQARLLWPKTRQKTDFDSIFITVLNICCVYIASTFSFGITPQLVYLDFNEQRRVDGSRFHLAHSTLFHWSQWWTVLK